MAALHKIYFLFSSIRCTAHHLILDVQYANPTHLTKGIVNTSRWKALELSGVFHAITGANGRFRTGQIMDVGKEGLDVYNSMLAAMGANRRLGPTNRDAQAVDAIRR